MAFYLRDQHVVDIAADSEALRQLSDVFQERLFQLHAELPEGAPQGQRAFFSYIIRFDNKGYRVFSFEELMRYFTQAKEVERVIFTVETGDAISSNRNVGAYLELCLDTRDPARCLLASSSDNKDWSEASFAAVYEILDKCKTKNGIARSPWASLGVQILGVIVGFVLSLLASFKVAPHLTIENPFVISFLFLLLVFSNIWGYLNQAILVLITKLFPNVEFIRPQKARLHWIMQAIVGSAAFAFVLYVLSVAFAFVSRVIGGFFSAGA